MSGQSRNVIFTACVEYNPNELLPFFKSCRSVFDGEIVVVAGKLSRDAINLVEAYGGRVYDVTDCLWQGGFQISLQRYGFYRDFIDRHALQFDNALLCDSRDIIFQAAPFATNLGYSLKFYLEDILIQDCPKNTRWIRDVYAQEDYDSIKHNWASCSGTTFGSRSGIINYLDRMIEESNKLWASNRPVIGGVDQGIHNYLVYAVQFFGATTVPNRQGEVQSMAWQQEFLLSEKGQLLNIDKQVCPIVHQYDRQPIIMPAVMHGNNLSNVLDQLKGTPKRKLSSRLRKLRRSFAKRLGRKPPKRQFIRG